MKRFSKKKGCLFLAMLLVFVSLLQIPAFAAVPSRPGNQSVLDSAGVLSDQLEQEITRKNQQLFQETGAEIAVVAVDFLDGEEIDDYAYELFSSWGIGSQERNNGLLLVLAIAEDDYFALPGYGIEDTFSGGHLQTMLDDYLEADFAAGNYESGVRKFFDAAYSELSAYPYDDEYSKDDDFYPGGEYEDWSGGYEEVDSLSSDFFFSILGFLITIAMVVLVIVVIVAIIRALSRPPYQNNYGAPQYRQRDNFWTGMFLGRAIGRNQQRNHWGAPPPPPPPPPPGGFGSTPRPPRNNGGFGGFGSGHSSGFGGFTGGGSSHRPSGGSHRPSGGGFSRGGGSRGGGAGRRK